jgi:hypothetical protein
VWERWLEKDPVRVVATHADVLRSMRAIYIDAGTKDAWFLDLGAEAFRRELEKIGVTYYVFELFDAKHGSIEYRGAKPRWRPLRLRSTRSTGPISIGAPVAASATRNTTTEVVT